MINYFINNGIIIGQGGKIMVGKTHKSIGYLIVLSLCCAIVGSFIGDLLKPYLPELLAKSFVISAGPLPIDLKVVNITFGFGINMNFMSIIGLIVALIIYKTH